MHYYICDLHFCAFWGPVLIWFHNFAFLVMQDGATLMHYAVQTACIQTVKTLLLYNVDVNLSDDVC
jgi:hypothetical protein